MSSTTPPALKLQMMHNPKHPLLCKSSRLSETDLQECSPYRKRLGLSSPLSSSCSSEEQIHEFWEENLKSFKIEVRLNRLLTNRTGLHECCVPTSDQASPLPQNIPIEVDCKVCPNFTQESASLDLSTSSYSDPEYTDDLPSPGTSCSRGHIVGTTSVYGATSVTVDTLELTPRNIELPCHSGNISLQPGEKDPFDFIVHMARNVPATSLLGYTSLLCHACVYGLLIREAHEARLWVRQMMAETDQLFTGQQSILKHTKSSRKRHACNEKYLTRLKNILDEVIEQKAAIESLIHESWAYLDHDPDSLLYFDIADLENTWLRLQDKLRKTGSRPWTSLTPLSELDHYFDTRKDQLHKGLRRSNDTERLNLPVFLTSTSTLDSFPCSLSIQSFHSSSFEAEGTQCISSISSKFEFSSKSNSASESPLGSLSVSPGDRHTDFISPSQFDKEKVNKFISDRRFISFHKGDWRSLPDFSHSRQTESYKTIRSYRSTERNFSNKEYIFKETDKISFLNNSGSSDSKLRDTRIEEISNGSHQDAFYQELSPLVASECKLLITKAIFPSSLENVCSSSMEVPRMLSNGHGGSGRSSPSSGRSSPLGVRPATQLGVDDSPVLQKRRRMNHELPVGDQLSVSGGSSPRDSPASLHLMLNPGILPSFCGSASFDDTFDELSDSQLSGQEMSPSVIQSQKKEVLRKKYRKDELWAAIQSDYHYLMDGEIIETCKRSIYTEKNGNASTESDLSWESDDLLAQTKVSFTEFMQQYKELTEWLNHIQMMTQRQGASLSEKYLNQTYHEEMLQRSPRRKVFNDYAKQLMRRYPSMKDEIQIRLQHLNGQWETLEKVISPAGNTRDEQTMLRDLEQDLNGLRTWLHDVESRLLPLSVHPKWNKAQLETKLKEHQVLQRDIESHSKIVSAVLKLCEHLQSDKNACSNEVEKDSLQLVAINLERRWHAIWLQSLEWQCRLEEALTRGKGVHSIDIKDDDWRARFGYSQTTTVGISNHDLTDGQSSCDEELSELIDSDNSNYDIIPFSENEYEKITVDTDCQTDPAEDGKLSPGGASASSKGSGCSSGMDPAIDSALGRSVSDHSINNDHHQITSQSALKITTDQVNRAVSKVVSFAQEPVMRGYEAKSRDKTKKLTMKGDHDIGYSSESHSNDEPDFGCQPLGGDQEVPTNICDILDAPREGSPDTSIERPRSLDTILLRRKNQDGSSEENTADSGTMPSPVTLDKSWRHSMTSAYETSSQCSASRSNSPVDLNATLDTTVDASAIDRGTCELENESYNSIQDLMSCSSQSFYIMTSVESDGDTVNSKIPCGVADITTGTDPCREGEADPHDTEPTCQSSSVFDSSGRVLSGLNHSTPVKDQEKVSSASDSVSLFPCSPVKSEDLPLQDVEAIKVRSGSLSVQVDSDASARDALLSSGELNTPLPVAQESTQVRNSIHKLVQQAELMVRETDLAPPSNKLRRRRKARSSKHRLAVAAVDSYTDTSVHQTDSPVSSCDASAESESDGEVSKNSTDKRHTRGDIRMEMAPKCNTLPRAKCDQRHGKFHTCSVTQLYELSNRLDLAPFSISEGAIDCAATARKVRRLSNTPYRKRKFLPRSASYECGETLNSQLQGSQNREFWSMPGSRQQSSQEWAHALTSPDQSPCIENRFQEWPAQQEAPLPCSQTAAQVPSHPLDRDTGATKTVEESDNEVTWRSVFNTTGEFSENAWDPYQDPPYQVTSDDPTEEKLDPLGFENDLEYDQYFHLDTSFGCNQPAPDTATRPREKHNSVSVSYRDLVEEDSDSDLEELQHVVEESRKQIGVAENILNNHHKDSMGTGLYLDPSHYTELVATCQTNIRCLEVLCDTIDSGEVANSTITDDDLHVVQEVIDRWGELHCLAVVRQQQSRELAGLVREMAALRTAITDTTDELELLTRFEDVNDIETAIKDLQTRQMEMSQGRPVVEGIGEAARQFAVTHPAVNMAGFAGQIQDLAADLHHIADRCGQHVSGLKSALMTWYDFRETTKELSYLVGRDRHQLQCLAMTHDVISTCLKDAVDTVHDLKLMKAEFELYESKLWSLRTLSADILPVCEDGSAADIRSVVSRMDTEVCSISTACDDLLDTLQDKVIKQGGRALLRPDSLNVEARGSTRTSQMDLRGTEADRPSLLWRILRIALPLHLTLVVLLGLAYLLDPDSFSIFISPQLRYVRGPPPV